MRKKVYILSALAVLAVVFFASQSALAQFNDYKTFEKLANEDPAKLAGIVADSRAMSYYLTGSVVADTDEVNGNSYNWREQGTATINGMPQMFEFGLNSADRCTDSSDPEDLEPLLMEHWYEYDVSWGGAIKRSTSRCSSIQYGTVCKAGACVPVPVPPMPRIDKKVLACEKWLFGGCVCADNYLSAYSEEDGAHCEQTEEIRFAYNALTGNWDEYVKSANWYRVEDQWKPEWIYSDGKRDAFTEAAREYQAAPEPYKQEKPERSNGGSECVRNLERDYRSVFETCFREVGPAQKYEKYTTCVGATTNSAYRAAALACGKELLNMSSAPTISNKSDDSDPADQPVNVNLDQLAKFRLGVEQDAERIINRKQCSGSSQPSQNPCVASQLDQLVSYVDEATDVSSLGRVRTGDITSSALTNPAGGVLTVSMPIDMGVSIKDVYEPQMAIVGEWKPMVGKFELTADSFIVTDQQSIQLTNRTMTVEIMPGSGVVVSGRGKDDTQSVGPDPVPFIDNTDGSSQADAALIFDIKFGEVTVENAGADSKVEVRTPLTVTKSKHTKFTVAYDPEQKTSATTIDEGEVEVTDRFTGETTILKPTDDGQPSTLVVPLAQAAEPVLAVSESKSVSGWTWLIILIFLLGGGFWLHKKGLLKKIFTKN